MLFKWTLSIEVPGSFLWNRMSLGSLFMVQPVITLVELSHLPRKDTASTDHQQAKSVAFPRMWSTNGGFACGHADEGHTSTVC